MNHIALSTFSLLLAAFREKGDGRALLSEDLVLNIFRIFFWKYTGYNTNGPPFLISEVKEGYQIFFIGSRTDHEVIILERIRWHMSAVRDPSRVNEATMRLVEWNSQDKKRGHSRLNGAVILFYFIFSNLIFQKWVARGRAKTRKLKFRKLWTALVWTRCGMERVGHHSWKHSLAFWGVKRKRRWEPVGHGTDRHRSSQLIICKRNPQTQIYLDYDTQSSSLAPHTTVLWIHGRSSHVESL